MSLTEQAQPIQETLTTDDGQIVLGTPLSPDGQHIGVDRHSLRRDGKPWLPVMGEFHYARYPREEWRDALLAMKMGGIDIVATYVFWIHHEETEGDWDWADRRSLREFVRLCDELGLFAVVRCGPWCHGECRNGGLPDWLLTKDLTPRSDDPAYLRYVLQLYAQIADQIRGLIWKDGGPIIGFQFENEYTGPAQHLLTLKSIALEMGMDAPLYTRTGWPELKTPMPPGELLPLYGGYPDGFWDRSLQEMPPGFAENFLFRSARNDASVATDQLGVREIADEPDNEHYPYFACEIGGGMMTSYHRRIRIAPRDIEALALAKLGSGNNLQGYYMYHGGTNPEGRLSTLQESQETGYWNDLPQRTYDFQAPLGEFGQVRGHYHSLRRMHLFLRDFGATLACQPAQMPADSPIRASDMKTLRWSARTDGYSGFVFVNNYQRLQDMPPKANVQFRVPTGAKRLTFPAEPVTVPSGGCFFWPFHLDLGGARLLYATAQPVCQITDGDTLYVVFAQTPGVPAEFVWDPATVTVESCSGRVAHSPEGLRTTDLETGLRAALSLRTSSAHGLVRILLLNHEQSLTCYKAELLGLERLFLTPASLIVDEAATLRLRSESPEELGVHVFPPVALADRGQPLQPIQDGLFQHYRLTADASPLQSNVVVEPVRQAGEAPEVKLGREGVAEPPSEHDFHRAAAAWRLRLTPPGSGRDALLRIHYTGDIARLYLDGKLLTDNFYNGAPFEVGLKRYAPEIYEKELLLKVMPLRSDAPIYLPQDARQRADEASADGSPTVEVELVEIYSAVLTPAPTAQSRE